MGTETQSPWPLSVQILRRATGFELAARNIPATTRDSSIDALKAVATEHAAWLAEVALKVRALEQGK